MARPTARVLALLEILQGGGTRTVGDLAARIGVDERTVRRYVSHLIDLDVPVESVRGRYGGYRLMPGYRMPPLMLTDDEAVAVLLGLVAGRRAGLTVSGDDAADRATAKLRRVLPTALATRMNALLETVEFTSPERSAGTPETDLLLRLAAAARAQQVVDISYTDRHARRTERSLRPYGVVAHNGRWYLTAADAGSGEERSFRLDRIDRVTAREERFEPRAGFDATAHLLDGLSRTPWRYEVSVRVRGDAATVQTRLPRGIAATEQIDSDWTRLRLRAERLDWVPGILANLGVPFVVEGPEELRDEVRRLAGRLAAAADPL